MTAKNEKHITTRAEIESKIEELRSTRIAMGLLINTRDYHIANISEEYSPQIETCAKEAQELEAEIIQWAKDNRATEFGEAKTLDLATGAKIQFRKGNKSVVFAAGKDEKKVIAAMQRRKLIPFLKITTALNRQAITGSWGTKLLPEKLAKACGLRLEQEEKCTLDVPLATAGKEQA